MPRERDVSRAPPIVTVARTLAAAGALPSRREPSGPGSTTNASTHRFTSIRIQLARPGAPSRIQYRELALRVKTGTRREDLPIPAQRTVLAISRTTTEPPLRSESADWGNAVGLRTTPENAPARTSVAAPVKIEELTGLVIQQLDRRLIAYRERMGRV